MSLAILSAQAITDLVGDAGSFDHCVSERFRSLDTHRNGVLSLAELRRGLDDVSPAMEQEVPTEDEVRDLYDKFFASFDEDNDGMIDPGEFKSLLREMMLALARGIGGTPVLMALQPESFLIKAAEHESGQRKKNQMVSESATGKIPSSRARGRKSRSHGGGLLVCFSCGARSTKQDDS